MSTKKKKYSIFKAISWYAVGNIFVKSISFFVLPFLSDLINTNDFGVYTVFSSYSLILDSIVIFGLVPTLRLAKYEDNTNYDSYVFSILFIPAILCGILYIISFIYFLFNSQFLAFGQNIWNWLIIYSLANVFCLILSGKLVLDGNYKAYFLYLLINTIIGIGMFFVLAKTAFVSSDVYMARIVGQLIGNVVSVIFLLSFVKEKTINTQYIKKGVLWGMPLIVHSFTISLFGQLDTILIKAMSDFSEVGVYGMAGTIALIPGTLEATFENAWNPWFFEEMNNGDINKIKKANNIYLLVSAVIIIEFMMVSPEIIHFLDFQYWDSVYYLMPLTINYFIELIYLIPLNVQYFHKNTKNVMFATIIATIADAIMVFVFIKLFGFIGGLYAKTLAKILLVLIHDYFAKKLDPNDYVSKKAIVFSLASLFIANIVIILLINELIVRYICFFTIGIILVIFVLKNRKDIMEMFGGI